MAFGAVLFLTGFIGLWAGWVESPQDGSNIVVQMSASAYFVVLGSLILWKAPGNRVGWVFSYMGLAMVASGLTENVGGVGNAFWLTGVGTVAIVLMWYPTGQCIESISNPIGIEGVPNPEFSSPILFLILVTLLSLVSLVFRYRNAARVERLQLKWFLFASSGIVASIVGELIFEEVLGMETPGWVSLLGGVSILAMPIAATLAILRYRLFDIDRIISRTLTYALLAGFLGLVFFGLVTVVSNLLPGESPLAVAAATLAIAALFNPVRKRVQGWVDRRFNRSRYDAERVMDEFAGSLQDRVDSDDVVDGWMVVVSETMQPSSVTVWVRDS